MNYTFTPLGDASIVIQLGETIDPNIPGKINAVISYLEKHPFPGMIEFIPAYTTLTIFYDPLTVESSQDHCETSEVSPYQLVSKWMDRIIANLPVIDEQQSSVIDIPVCYGGGYGPDMKVVAQHNGLTEEEVVAIHAGGDYLVYMIGFAPGFPYIGGMSDKIATPRRDSPRLKIPPRTVGIAGTQTGVYPIEAPGGWQLIGQTPLQLFQPHEEVPSLLKPGNAVRFYPISKDEFRDWQEEYHEY